jgi:hypothetical protein
MLPEAQPLPLANPISFRKERICKVQCPNKELTKKKIRLRERDVAREEHPNDFN